VGLRGVVSAPLRIEYFIGRALRTQFYPKVNDLLSAYVIRMQTPEGQYLMQKVGYEPLPEDEAFVEHRIRFMMNLVAFNELKEARELRRKLLEHQGSESGGEGDMQKIDLMPDYQALSDCLDKMEKKLKLS
jgi:hypothetical protein